MTSDELFSIVNDITKKYKPDVTNLVRLFLKEIRNKIDGKIVDADGRPLGDWHVACVMMDAIIGSDFRFILSMERLRIEHNELHNPWNN